ncbi:MAG TPA: hypothetical protein DCX92_11850 [Bacteroidetes bacterium]|nr:hypothetical protein [Bacteroidota bacterium]
MKEAELKTLIAVSILFFTASVYTQTDTTILQKRFDAAEHNIDMAGSHFEDAANNFNKAWFFGFVGSLTTGVLIATLDKTSDGNINPVAFVPGLVGFIGSIWSYFTATGHMREAGYYMRKSKKK